MNEAMINEEVEAFKKEVSKDVQKEVRDMFKKAFKGSKFITLK